MIDVGYGLQTRENIKSRLHSIHNLQDGGEELVDDLRQDLKHQIHHACKNRPQYIL